MKLKDVRNGLFKTADKAKLYVRSDITRCRRSVPVSVSKR